MTTTTLDQIRTITDATQSDADPDITARGIWTMITEPGDSNTGELITQLGANEALR